MDVKHELFPRGFVVESLEALAKRHPESKEQYIGVLVRQLEQYEENDRILNGFLVSTLEKLKAHTTYPLIEAAFKAQKVDIQIIDLDMVQYK